MADTSNSISATNLYCSRLRSIKDVNPTTALFFLCCPLDTRKQQYFLLPLRYNNVINKSSTTGTMKIFATLCTSALLVNLAHSSLIVSNVVLAAYGKKTLVDSIAISGELYIGKKARLPRGSLDFRCSAVEFAAKQLPEAPEQVIESSICSVFLASFERHILPSLLSQIWSFNSFAKVARRFHVGLLTVTTNPFRSIYCLILTIQVFLLH